MKNEPATGNNVHLNDELGVLPAPRLQFRWVANPDAGSRHEWLCYYELVLPLHEHDIRRELYDDDGEQTGEINELVIALGGPTKRGSNHEPCRNMAGRKFFDDPYRDGAHAKWDSEALGGLPIFAIDVDGTAIPKTPNA